MVKNEYYSKDVNFGDCLSPIIFNWILNEFNIQNINKNEIQLLTLGSILAANDFRESNVVWGTGIHYIEDISKLVEDKKSRVLDIRAVRGPLTRQALQAAGYICPNIYGDPAILMPLIYSTEKKIEKEKITLIRHYGSADLSYPSNINNIDIRTQDYRNVIDQICSSEKVISSSLHGIIVAESYGIPCVFLQENVENELLKYYDWYWSTNRKKVKITYTLEEAIQANPMELPDVTNMRKMLLQQFPKDIFSLDYTIKKKNKKIVLYGAGKCFHDKINYIKNICKVEYVVDTNPKKWGKIENISCFPFEKLLEDKEDILVVITLERKDLIEAVCNSLLLAGIYYFDSVKNFLKYVNSI